MKNPFTAIFDKVVSGRVEKRAVELATGVVAKFKEKMFFAGGAGGGYSGRGSSQSGGGSKFNQGLSASGRSLSLDHFKLRQNTRDAIFDSPQARMLVERYADTVVDTGLKLKPTPKFNILGITAENAESWADDVAERFDMWASGKHSDYTGINTFYQNQHLYHFFQQRDNDIFVRFHYSKSKELVNPLQLQFIDPNQIRGYGYTSTYAPYPNQDGIIRDAAGRETGYKVWHINHKYEYTEKEIPARGARSKRTMMIHGFRPEFAGQGRGFSRFAHMLQEIENLTDFTVSHMLKAIQDTIFGAYVKPGPNNPATNPIDDLAGPRESTTLDTSAQADGAETVDDDPVIRLASVPEMTVDIPGSVNVFNLKEGEDLQSFKATTPSDNYPDFIDAFFTHLAASSGMPVEVALMKFGTNYSASRASLVMFWRVAQIWRKEMKSDYFDFVYESWLSGEIAAGRIQAPGWNNPIMKQAWLSAIWSGAPMPNIDPMKTAKADMLYVEMGAQTLDDVAENLNGSSGKSNRAKIAREFEEIPESPWNKKPAAPGSP